MAEPITRFYPRFYDSPQGKIALVTMDNGHDYRKPNTFSEAALMSLNEALDRILSEGDVKGMLLTGKPYSFAAGADISQFPLITTFEQGYRSAKFGHTVMQRIRDLPFPTLAAVNGVALGGGLEIALYCRYRTVAPTVAAVGFPECFLGMVPAWGGCTLGTKLLGPEKAVELIIVNALSQNRLLDGVKAFEAGLADRLFPAVEFLDESLQFLLDILAGRITVERRALDTGRLGEVVAGARAFVDSKVHGAAPAPYRALELIEGACSWDVERGFEEENKAAADLILSKQCKASLYSFDLVNRYAKRPRGVPEAPPRPIRKVGIIGAGLMASQLAHLFIHRLGVPVVMKDVKQELLDKGCAYVAGEFRKMVERGRMSEGRARHSVSLLHGTLDARDFADCDFVLEAVFEQMEVKKQVFADAERVLRPDAILASNTSSLSLTEMAADLEHPERVVGVHFFNPVAVLPLVEIIQAGKTDASTLATAFDVAGKLKKTAVLVKDSPAFLVNRLLSRMLSECMSIVDEGGEFQQVDEALLALGLPMAPFELLPLVGLPVALHVLETLNLAFGWERFPVSPNFKKLVEARKAGIYLREGGPKRVDPDVERLWVKTGGKAFHAGEIRHRVLYSLARETDLILNEKVVSSPKEVDLAMILGAGWPFFMGGLTVYLDLEGIALKVLGKVFSGT